MNSPSTYLRRLPVRSTQLIRHQQRWMSVVHLSDSDAVDKFRTINERSVMYFTASWCPPCKMISPVYDELSKKYPKVAFGKIDVDENQNAAMEFQISAVPTFIFSKGSEATNKFSGADKTQLEKLVQELE
ncbi:hypothetical protein ACHAWO_003066 [Cyclotella atomus]|uniref:Thioredoxin domain-containing protein n=1 Tax=Cyclotella atomus TaxID=382360 RepID=A0ABD3ND67_9STRA